MTDRSAVILRYKRGVHARNEFVCVRCEIDVER